MQFVSLLSFIILYCQLLLNMLLNILKTPKYLQLSINDLKNQHTSPNVFILLSFLSYIVSIYVFVYNHSVFIYLYQGFVLYKSLSLCIVYTSPRFLCRPTALYILLEPWDVGELYIRKTADLPLRLLVGTFPRFVAIGFYFLSETLI